MRNVSPLANRLVDDNCDNRPGPSCERRRNERSGNCDPPITVARRRADAVSPPKSLVALPAALSALKESKDDHDKSRNALSVVDSDGVADRAVRRVSRLRELNNDLRRDPPSSSLLYLNE